MVQCLHDALCRHPLQVDFWREPHQFHAVCQVEHDHQMEGFFSLFGEFALVQEIADLLVECLAQSLVVGRAQALAVDVLLFRAHDLQDVAHALAHGRIGFPLFGLGGGA